MSLTPSNLISIFSDSYTGIDTQKSKYDDGKCGVCHDTIPLETRVDRLGCGHLFCAACIPNTPVFERCPMCRVGIAGRYDQAERALRSIEAKTQRYFLLAKKILPSEEALILRGINERLSDLRSRTYSLDYFKAADDKLKELITFFEAIIETDDEGFSLMIDQYTKIAVRNIKSRDFTQLLNDAFNGIKLSRQALDSIKPSIITVLESASEPYKSRILEFSDKLHSRILENEDYIALASNLSQVSIKMNATDRNNLLLQMLYTGFSTGMLLSSVTKYLRISDLITLEEYKEIWIVISGSLLAMIPHGLKCIRKEKNSMKELFYT